MRSAIRLALGAEGISSEKIQALKRVTIIEDDDEQELAVLLPYEEYLEMQNLILRADALLPDPDDTIG